MVTILRKNLVNIATANALRDFGGALVEVFVPLLLVQRGLTLLDVSLFYLAYAAVKLAVNYYAVKFANNFGARPNLLISRFAYILYLLCLVSIVRDGSVEFVWLMAVLLAITNAFQLSAQHLHVSRVIQVGHRGSDIARIDALSMIATSVAPAVSAVLALVLDVSWPLYVAVASILISTLWLRSIDSEAGGHRRGERLRLSLSYAPMRDLVANFAHNTHSAIGGLVWPMYLAFVLPHIQSIGFVTAIGSLGAVVFLLFIGGRNDNVGTRKVLREGSVATFVAHLLRVIPATVVTVSLINLVWQLAARYQQNPWTSTYYAHTREKGAGYILSMELANDFAYIVLFVVVFAALSTFGYQTGFTVLFVLAAFISLVCMIITPIKSKR